MTFVITDKPHLKCPLANANTTTKLILHQVSPTTRQGDERRKKQRRFFHSVSEINDVAQPVDQLVAALYCTSADLLDGRSKGGRWWCAAGSCPGQGVISLPLSDMSLQLTSAATV